MTETPNANDVLMGGGGAPAAKFEQPGTVHGGRIVAPPRTHQERDYKPGQPGQGALKVFPSGDPIYGLTVDVQTEERTDNDDDGVRRLWIEGKRLKEAVRDAVRAANASALQTGGTLHVRFTGLGEPAGPGMQPPKLWEARYVPPTPGPATQEQAWGAPQQAPQQAQQQQQQQPFEPPQQQGFPPAPGTGSWPQEPPY